MSRWDHTTERDIYRAMVVDAFTDASWRDYLRARSRADDGRTNA